VGCGGGLEGASSVDVLLLGSSARGVNGGVVPASSWLLVGGADAGRSAMVSWSCTWWWYRWCEARMREVFACFAWHYAWQKKLKMGGGYDAA